MRRFESSRFQPVECGHPTTMYTEEQAVSARRRDSARPEGGAATRDQRKKIFRIEARFAASAGLRKTETKLVCIVSCATTKSNVAIAANICFPN